MTDYTGAGARTPAALGQARRERLAAARLYVCTPIRPDLAELAEAVYGAGVDVVQLRDKQAEAAELVAASGVVRAAAGRHGALFAMNDRADVALATDADICHLGQGDLAQPWARRILGEGVLLGRSTHSRAQAARAIAAGWDYVVAGPVYQTATKPGRPATGLQLLREVDALQPPMPWFAIGGIDLTTVDSVVAAGATRAVIVRAVIDAADPAAAAAALRARLGAVAARKRGVAPGASP